MNLDLVITDVEQITLDQMWFTALLAKSLSNLLKYISHETACSLMITAEKDMTKPTIDIGNVCHPIRFYVSALNTEGAEVFDKTLWVYVDPIGRKFLFADTGQRVCREMSTVITEIGNHLIKWLEE